MKEWISGQNSDGLGEGFEQRPIETVDGYIYVHFWNSGDEYFIVTADELQHQLHPQTVFRGQSQNDHPTLYGIGGGETAELHSVREVAQFIYQKGLHSDVLITKEGGTPFITTFGIFIDKIADMDYREELLKELVPLQMGEQDGNMSGMSM